MDFKDLFIFEMANSHQGSLEHGSNIIKRFSKIVHKYNIKGAIKLQYRDLDTFIHPEFKNNFSIPHVERFQSTRLCPEDFNLLVKEIKNEDLIAMSTTFDEKSVEMCLKQDLDIIKIASCSASDWPLLQKIAETKKPVIISTGGLSFEQIDKVYYFFKSKGTPFSLLYCVPLYPAPSDCLHLRYIKEFKDRYPDVTIGYSGHESPNDYMTGCLATALGAEVLERHIGLPTDQIKLNSYSMDPEQAEIWVREVLTSKTKIQGSISFSQLEREQKSLDSLKRGVYAKAKLHKGETISSDNVFYAFPLQNDQVESGEFTLGMVASRDYNIGDPLKESSGRSITVEDFKLKVDILLREAGLSFISSTFDYEFSHHYGLENFTEIGCTIFNIINDDYCKKIIVLLKGQTNPEHYHKLKKETFLVLKGQLELLLEGKVHILNPGEMITVLPGSRHSFSSDTGCVFEEISSEHHKDDSFYTDKDIQNKKRDERKTHLSKQQ